MKSAGRKRQNADFELKLWFSRAKMIGGVKIKQKLLVVCLVRIKELFTQSQLFELALSYQTNYLILHLFIGTVIVLVGSYCDCKIFR